MPRHGPQQEPLSWNSTPKFHPTPPHPGQFSKSRNFVTFCFSFYSQSNDEKKVDAKRERIIQFLVRLCSDVFLDVICWGNRRQLKELEKIGRRLHWLIDGRFKRAPFLRLDLFIKPRYLFSLKFRKFKLLFILVVQFDFRAKQFLELIFCQFLHLSVSIPLC